MVNRGLQQPGPFAIVAGTRSERGMMLTFARHPNSHWLRTLAPLILLWWLSASAAQAHTQPKPIQNWGPFLVDTVPCLRMMSRATHVCFDAVLDAEQRCREALTRGNECDMEALTNTIDVATGAMRRTLAQECTPGQLTELGYIALFDAEADLFNACALQARWAVTATYAPANGGVAPPAVADCLTASAGYARRVMRFALDQQTPVIERFATRIYPNPEDKLEVVRRLQTAFIDVRPRWAEGLLAVCPDFATIYGRTPDSYLRTLTQRTDCVLSKTYVNTAVSCMAEVCGNGIPEGDEECDDGNHTDTDACSNGCLINH
jgi:cysteine-rich repeat protein